MVEDVRRRWDPHGTLTVEGLDALIDVQREKVKMAELRVLESLRKGDVGDVAACSVFKRNDNGVGSQATLSLADSLVKPLAEPLASCGDLSTSVVTGGVGGTLSGVQPCLDVSGLYDVMDLDFSSMFGVDLMPMPLSVPMSMSMSMSLSPCVDLPVF
jgi:hypothetical protein